MSVLYQNNCNILIDHSKYINKIYSNVSSTDESNAYKINLCLFSIIVDKELKEVPNKKRKLQNQELNEECSRVKYMYEQFLSMLPAKLKQNRVKSTSSEVRDRAQKLFEATVFEHRGINGGNNSDSAILCTVKDNQFLIPSNCRFYCGCVKEQCEKLNGSKYDIVVADPPWWNKYIRRLKHANEKLSYSMMYNEDIASIPVRNVLSPNCLVAIWCTNAPSNIAAVKELIFPQWGVDYLTTWYWLKVTTDMEPLCDFSTGCKKQPYERIILGKVGDVKVPEDQLIVSVPSALHSHKPPLLELLSPYVKTSTPQTLELFARYLLPNTTSVGFEPLKWQHISLYEKVC
ncbi:N(6)-adenine-specific methyltransferase METTL4 [Cydia strobilella]|uniref:N(6)-adenine-specific methyltransferase METTL4 n=1 Tax=Cydia strobilella TaxID=1100964 RepID=UPI0030051268